LIIPAYLRTPWDAICLRRLVASAAAQAGLGAVVVVDDASPLPAASIVGGAFCVRLDSNGGPARARNVGIERALALGAEVLLFADHDCILQDGWARSFRAFLDGSAHSLAGGLTKSFGRTMLDRFHDFNGTLNGRWVLPERRELLYAPTCNLAIRAEVARDFRFDERYPTAAGEDVDFCLRARRRYSIGLCREAVLLHDYGYSSLVGGLPRFVRLFKKYKAANALLWSDFSGLSWTHSEAIPSETA
jgi:GT2 family glycosyltransferase